MIKKIENFVCSKGLSVDRNNYFGIIDGIQINGSAPLISSASIAFSAYVPAEAERQLVYWLESHKNNYFIFDYCVGRSGVEIKFRSYATIDKYIRCFEEFFSVFSQNCIRGRCPLCGEDLVTSTFVEINGRHLRVHENCYEQYAQRATKASETQNQTKNTVLGLIGVILGTVFGCFLWVVLYEFGFIAAFASIIMSIGASFLWNKFGGENGTAKIVSIWVVTITLLTITLFSVYLISVRNWMNELNLAGTGIEWFLWLLREDESFCGSFVFDIVMSEVFIIVSNIIITFRIISSRQTNFLFNNYRQSN